MASRFAMGNEEQILSVSSTDYSTCVVDTKHFAALTRKIFFYTRREISYLRAAM